MGGISPWRDLFQGRQSRDIKHAICSNAPSRVIAGNGGNQFVIVQGQPGRIIAQDG